MRLRWYKPTNQPQHNPTTHSYWLQADATWDLRHPPSLLRKQQREGPVRRPLSLAEWREEKLAGEVRRGRRRLTDRGGLMGWVEDRWLRWRWRDRVRRWEWEGREGVGVGEEEGASAALEAEEDEEEEEGGYADDDVGGGVDYDEGGSEDAMGGLEDPRRLASLALQEEKEGEGAGMWSMGEEAEARLGLFDLDDFAPAAGAEGVGGQGQAQEKEGDVPLRLKAADLAVLKSFLEGKAAALASAAAPTTVAPAAAPPAPALWGRRETEADMEGEEEEWEYEYMYADEVPAGELGDYEMVDIGGEEERLALAAMTSLDQQEQEQEEDDGGGSSGSSSSRNPRRNERFVVRSADGAFYAPSSGRRLEPVGGAEEEEGGEGEEEGPTPPVAWAPLEAVSLRGTAGLVVGHTGGHNDDGGDGGGSTRPSKEGNGHYNARLAATLRRAVRGRVLAALARRVEAGHGGVLRQRGVPLEMVTFHLVRILRGATTRGFGVEGEAPSFRLWDAPRLLWCVRTCFGSWVSFFFGARHAMHSNIDFTPYS